MTGLLTPAEVAERLRISEALVYELRKRHQWPCVLLGRKTIRFTEEQVEQIVARHATTPKAPAPTSAIKGQTTASARRRSA